MFRTALVRVQAPARARFFSTTPVVTKSVVDTAKDALKKVDRTVSDGAVKGIEVGEKAASTIKSALPNDTTEAKYKAESAAKSAKDSLPDNAEQAKGQAQELAGEAKGKASELAGETKGTKEEYKGKAKGKVEEVKGKTGV